MGSRLLQLAFVGDVSLSFFDGMRASDLEFTNWSEIRDEIGQHDFLVGNLECCLVDEHCSQEAREQVMAVPVAATAFLHDIGFSDLCLANNHSLDCGPEAVTITREHLASCGIRTFGAGANLREAEDPVFVDSNDCKVAFLGACDRSEYYASDSRAGIAPLEKARLGARVRAAAAKADLVVVTLHSDLEFSDVPGRWRQRLSRWLVDQGAHLVIQHHPHVLQGVERYQGGVIAYSLGNFIFPLRGNRYQEYRAGVFDSLVLVVEADLQGERLKLSYRLIPLRIGDNHLPYRASGASRDLALRRAQHLSSILADKKAHRSLWFRRCRSEATARFFGVYYAIRRGDIAGGRRVFRQLVTCREDRRWLLGLLSLGYF